MWLFLNNAMVSVVAHRTMYGHYMVRARLKGDIQRAFPSIKRPGRRILSTPNADYLYRMVVTKAELQAAVHEAVEAIDYTNFKSSIPTGHHVRRTAYHDVWDAMLAAQQREAPGTSCYGARSRMVDLEAGF